MEKKTKSKLNELQDNKTSTELIIKSLNEQREESDSPTEQDIIQRQIDCLNGLLVVVDEHITFHTTVEPEGEE